MVTSSQKREIYSLVAKAAVAVIRRRREKFGKKKQKPRRRKEEQASRSSANKRTRRTAEDSLESYGPASFRRAYRMSYECFCRLHNLLESNITTISNRRRPKSDPGERHHTRTPPVPNGPVSSRIRLAIALRYFQGYPNLAVQEIYQVSHAVVLDSLWIVVQAINEYQPFNLGYPMEHDKQLQIAKDFKECSHVNFDCCAGAIDGILIWIHQPTREDAKASGIDQRRYYCGRKSKFGLNCQAVADSRGRFLDISMIYGGAASDTLAFEASRLSDRLEKDLLAPGLTLFGDNAYLNTKYMTTPFPNVGKGHKDDYNFFQSQVRTTVNDLMLPLLLLIISSLVSLHSYV